MNHQILQPSPSNPVEQDIGLFFFLKHPGITSTLLHQLMHPRRVTRVLLVVGPPGFTKGDREEHVLGYITRILLASKKVKERDEERKIKAYSLLNLYFEPWMEEECFLSEG
jgi:hypothetical protein